MSPRAKRRVGAWLWILLSDARSQRRALHQVDNYGSILHRLVVMSYCDADTRRRQQGGM